MKNSHIQWTDHTFNPWIGCTKVSPGCAHCYAETRDQRFAGGVHWGAGAQRQRTSVANWKQPLKWNREAAPYQLEVGKWITPPRPRVFCASLADWLDDEVPLEWLADLLDLIHNTPNLDWLLLSKRLENWRKRIAAVVEMRNALEVKLGVTLGHWGELWLNGYMPPANVWIGTTVEDQTRADERIPALLSIPAKLRFLSCEPLLGPLDLAMCLPGTGVRKTPTGIKQFRVQGIDWLIIGGESGSKARPFNTEYALDLVIQCQRANVAVFVKQLGANPYTSNANAMEWPEEIEFRADGETPAAGFPVLSDRHGSDVDQWPKELRVREFPNNQISNSVAKKTL